MEEKTFNINVDQAKILIEYIELLADYEEEEVEGYELYSELTEFVTEYMQE